MLQTGHLLPHDKLEKKELLERLHQKIEGIDWKSARANVAPFITDKARLDIWSVAFFHEMAIHLRFLDT